MAAVLAIAAVVTVAVLAVLTAARPSGLALPDHEPDLARGEVLYHAGGCISCHKASPAAGVNGPPTGEAPFQTPVGTFWPGMLPPELDAFLFAAELGELTREGVRLGVVLAVELEHDQVGRVDDVVHRAEPADLQPPRHRGGLGRAREGAGEARGRKARGQDPCPGYCSQ